MSIVYIDIAEFRALGFVQEINRRFLHPHGLALEVVVEEDGSEKLGGVWDYRDDAEGIWYEGGLTEEESDRARALDDEWERRRPRREAGLGFMLEPLFSVSADAAA